MTHPTLTPQPHQKTAKGYNVVWFKRDFRVEDHEPLSKAMSLGPTLALVVVEKRWLEDPHFSNYHFQFFWDALQELEAELVKLNVPLILTTGEMIETLERLHQSLGIETLFSHEETGLMWTYKRDLAVKAWCKQQDITWLESKQFSVVRPLKSRDLWNSQRKKIILRETLPKPKPQNIVKIAEHGLPNYSPHSFSRLGIQKGGRSEAFKMLHSFLNHRGQNYQFEMSSPNTAYEACSRISAHLTWGTISLSEVQAELKLAQAEKNKLSPPEKADWFRGLRSFESRLWWHCHFIQKLEDEPGIEFGNINAGFDGMREPHFNKRYFEAWASGQTGYPMIDACMRALIETGWINFRMRALLISFASYQLWLHWKKTAEHLARLFVDFEPGIHYSQVQMQSGVTGINAIRIYSPLKQSHDQDPDGRFIRKYCPELKGFDDKYLHQPETTPPMLQHLSGCIIGKDYPEPIVDHKTAYNEAKDRIFSWRSRPEVKQIAKGVYQKHGSRKNKFFPGQDRDRAFGNCNS